MDNKALWSMKEVRESRNVENEKSALVKCINFMGPEVAINLGKSTWQIIKRDESNGSWEECDRQTNTGCPSKFLMMCLNSIQNSMHPNGALTRNNWDRPLFANAWGIEFWNSYANGNDVLDTIVADSTVEKIAWIVSTAADTISMKEKEGLSFDGPFLLYLVPSQVKAYKVQKVCTVLEGVGIQTMSLNSGASVDHHIHRLKSYEPEFIVSTPEMLLELLSLKAVDISEVSLMVVDGLETPLKGNAYLDDVKSVRQFILGNPQAVVFCDCK